MRTAIFGGTFNPIHLGHLLLAEAALSQASLNQVIWVPTGHPPHRASHAVLASRHRVEMVQRAIANHPAFTLSTIEVESSSLAEPSYAAQTFRQLQASVPACQWYWIVGLDTFLTLPRWYRRQDFLDACTWLIAPRLPHHTPAPANSPHGSDLHHHCHQVAVHLRRENIALSWQLLSMPLVAISSTLIRQYCRDRHSIRYLVPDSVREYIQTHNLYSL